MMRLPIHRRLLTTVILMLIGTGVAWFFLIRPITKANAASEAEQAQAAADLRRQGFPLVPEKLKQTKRDLTTQEAALQDRLRKVYDKARSQFASRLSAYPSTLGFRRSVFQLDYQEIYDRIRKELMENQIYLNEEILGLSVQSTSPQTYQLVARMWAVRDLAMLAHEHRLDLNDYGWRPRKKKDDSLDDEPPAPRHPPARIHVEPVRTYTVSKDEPYYLEEYPVRLTVTGSLQQITEFVSDLTKEGTFLPLESAALRKIDEEKPDSNRVEATLVCSAFLIISERNDFEVELEAQDKANIPPIRGGSP